MSRREIRSMADLRALQAMLAKGSPQIAANIAAKVAPVLSGLAQQSFDARESPYGEPWTTGIDGQQVDLNKSGKLRSSAVRYFAVGTKIRASVGAVRYARYQLRNGILPRQGQALPAHWQAAIRSVAQSELAKAVKL